MKREECLDAGFSVVGREASDHASDNKLVQFLKEHYPSVIKDNELDLNELKRVVGLPVGEKANGYGLNFVGRNFARAKYAQQTSKELCLNPQLSKDIEKTKNLLLKGDNLDSLKILKNCYAGKIKCIYIDPPYNTASDEFVYPDKFDKEEVEVLGLSDLSDDEAARMAFSFKTKKSHNGWLSFMYPRILLARDLLRDDGVIFISIDDNEQANLKLLCDDVFGEENCVSVIPWQSRASVQNDTDFSVNHEYICAYAKKRRQNNRRLKETNMETWYQKDSFVCKPLPLDISKFNNPDNDPRGPWKSDPFDAPHIRPNLTYPIINPNTGTQHLPPAGRCWRISQEKFLEALSDNRIVWTNNGMGRPQLKSFYNEKKDCGSIDTSWFSSDRIGTSSNGTKELMSLFHGELYFDTPKPISLIKKLIVLANTTNNDIILDFFAGSGTTGQAVMQLNAEDGGNRKFILCQIDEPVKKGSPAYKFCQENKMPPVISSITIERLRRAGKKIATELEEGNANSELFDEVSIVPLDVGFKVFDTVDKTKLELDEAGQISISPSSGDSLSRIYNMVLSVGLDEPTCRLEEVLEDCIYKIGSHYYVTNSERISADDYASLLKTAFVESVQGGIFIDGWTASLNGTLQSYKDNVKIVF